MVHAKVVLSKNHFCVFVHIRVTTHPPVALAGCLFWCFCLFLMKLWCYSMLSHWKVTLSRLTVYQAKRNICRFAGQFCSFAKPDKKRAYHTPYSKTRMYTHQFTFMFLHLNSTVHIQLFECIYSYAISWMCISYSKTWMYDFILARFPNYYMYPYSFPDQKLIFQNLNVWLHIQNLECELTSSVLPSSNQKNESGTNHF